MKRIKIYYVLRTVFSALACVALGAFVLWADAYSVEVFDVLLIALGLLSVAFELPVLVLSLRAALKRKGWEWLSVALSAIFIGFGVYVGFDHNFALYGTKGSILTDKTKPYKEAHSFAKMYDTPGTFEEAMEIPLGTSYSKKNLSGHGGADSKMMHEFFRCILEDTKPPIDVDLGIAMAIPGIYAHESAMNGGALVEIPEIL